MGRDGTMTAETRRLNVFAVALVVCATWAVLSYWSPVAQPRYTLSIVLPSGRAPPPNISRDPRAFGSQREGWSRSEVIAPDGGDDEDEGDQDDQSLPDDVYDI